MLEARVGLGGRSLWGYVWVDVCALEALATFIMTAGMDWVCQRLAGLPDMGVDYDVVWVLFDEASAFVDDEYWISASTRRENCQCSSCATTLRHRSNGPNAAHVLPSSCVLPTQHV